MVINKPPSSSIINQGANTTSIGQHAVNTLQKPTDPTGRSTASTSTTPWGTTVQYNPDGTAVVPEINTWGNNPFLDSYGQAQNAYGAAQQQSAQTIQNLQNQQNQYPTMENDYGLGSQPVAGSASNPGYLSEPITLNVPDTASRGFNPWSLTGEALSRGR